MKEPLPKTLSSPYPSTYDFHKMRRRGIESIQQLAGDRWNDFNDHDPGVTILEQLCYALTESIYKSTFPVADYLASPDGTIDYKQQTFYRPEEILPCRPVTTDDIRIAIFDAIPEMEDLYLYPTKTSHNRGLYTLHVHLTPSSSRGLGDPERQDWIKKIRAVYWQHRNLCEDIDTVKIIDPQPCRLEGHIGITGTRDPSELLAEIYFRCAELISPGIEVISYEEALRQGKSFDTLFTGPLTRCGYIRRRSARPSDKPITMSELFGVIRGVEGVTDIHDLRILDGADQLLQMIGSPSGEDAMALSIPGQEQEIGIILQKKDKRCPVSAMVFIEQYERLEFKRRAYKHLRQDFTKLYDLPQPVHRDIKSYSSIQHHFPKVYGIDADGIPDSADPLRKAQARQLKAYLLVFDQMMADFNSLLGHIGDLYSIDPDLRQTYFHQVLTEANVPDIDHVKTLSQKETDRRLRTVVGRYDNADDRRSRVLDYLLALHGEMFSQQYAHHLDPYGPASETVRSIIRNKIKLLKHLSATGCHRGGGENYRQATWDNHRIDGMALKVRLLLGLPESNKRSLTASLADHGMRVVSDTIYQRMLTGTAGEFSSIIVQATDDFEKVPPETDDSAMAPDMVRELTRRVILLQQGIINASLFTSGLSPDAYRIAPVKGGDGWQVVFKHVPDGPWHRLADYPARNEAIQATHAVCKLVLQLNLESEGFHVVEHILLRPLYAEQHTHIEVPEGFYPYRISVLMPDWTLRTGNPSFRRHAEDTLRLNCPAHLAIDVYWIDFDQMLAFEQVYSKWIDAKRAKPDGSTALDWLSAQLIRFLLDRADDLHQADDGQLHRRI